ncbi:YybH family protein [Rugamonas apoptosis]|uniref:Nuclear transport factor 2 family protein n=1 Tax=Rugamonas apoptosis TaxID=2758570 RepID=A0A7W2FE69_9BURK|nr:nuclear transport factor 2 family protein [Rugamonas apoptosis]MBA5689964.1 nuclear transport factor 2 family protein [Rugamonas apoptosis]
MSKVFNEELAAIKANAVAYLTAFNRADVAAVLATYADDGVLMAPGMPAAVGKDELAMVYPGVFATVGFDMTYEIKEVVQISADWAFVRSATEGTETNKATSVVMPAAYQELFLLRKSTAGAWQTARYCTSKIGPTV